MKSKVSHVFIFSILLLSCSTPSQQQLDEAKVIDLSYAYDENTVFWPTAEEFELEIVSAQMTDAGYYYAANNFCMAEHGGTHIDAPVHFSEGQWSVDEIPLERLIGQAVVVDVSEKCANDPDYQVNQGDFVAWEKAHGIQLNDVIVLIRTGFGKYWPDREKYMGTAERGADAVPKLHFPGLHPEAAQWLVENRSIKAIGLDTPSIDYGQSKLFESHVTLFAANIPAFENLANLDKLPTKDFRVVALPMKIKGGSGGPVRIIAMLSE